MNGSEFVHSVARRSGIPQPQVEALTRATLETLAERISVGEARDLATQLPEEFRGFLHKEDEFVERLHLAEFVHEVRARAGVDDQRAAEGARAVLSAVRDAVSAEAFEDLVVELPKDIRQLLQPVGRRVEA